MSENHLEELELCIPYVGPRNQTCCINPGSRYLHVLGRVTVLAPTVKNTETVHGQLGNLCTLVHLRQGLSM